MQEKENTSRNEQAVTHEISVEVPSKEHNITENLFSSIHTYHPFWKKKTSQSPSEHRNNSETLTLTP